ncbi:MAG: PLP-dependent aminotransferase family protein [Planctomycetaceae bacterium]
MATVQQPLVLSRSAQSASEQAISFLMQQAVENVDCISLAAGLVDEATLPADLARNTLNGLLTSDAAGRKVLQYGTTPGPDFLRKTFRSYIARLDENPAVEDVPLDRFVLTTGSQQLLALTSRALFDPGDICLVAAPTYFVYLGVLDGVGARTVAVRADAQGMCPEDLDRQLQQIDDEGQLHRVRMVYVVSYYDNPSGISVSEDRRPELLRITKKWSRDHRILLLEDAAYRELRYDGPVLPSIWSFDDDHDTVILAQTFSKSFSPGVRVGLGVLPEDLVKPVCDLKGNEDFGSPQLNQQLMSSVLQSPAYDEHLKQVTGGYRRKRDTMLNAADDFFSGIEGVSWVHPHGGLYVWMTLPKHIATGFDSDLFQRATTVDKVMYVPGELSYPLSDDRPNHQMRLSFGVQSEKGIREGMKRLASAVAAVDV